MNTKFVGIKEFRQNISKYAKHVTGTRYIVVNHKRPLFEVQPFAGNVTLDDLFESVVRAKADIAKKRTYSQAQIEKMLS